MSVLAGAGLTRGARDPRVEQLTATLDRGAARGQNGRTVSRVEIRTPTLVLRRPDRKDLDAILTIHSDPRACEHNPSDALATHDEAAGLLERWRDQWERHGAGYWTVRRPDNTEALGFCGLKFVELHQRRVLNLFCRLAPQSWGQGIGGEAATAAVGWGRETWPEVPIIARIRPRNIASQRMAVGCGLARAQQLDFTGEDGLEWLYVDRSCRMTRPVRAAAGGPA